MIYAILDNSVLVSYGSARDLWPGVSFPQSGPNAGFLAANSAVEVQSLPPYDPATQYLVTVEPYLLDGIWYSREPRTKLPDADFEGFVETVEDAAAWNNLINTIITNRGAIGYTIAGCLARVEVGDYQPFIRAWRKMVTAGLITPAQVSQVQTVATSKNLPDDFIDGLSVA